MKNNYQNRQDMAADASEDSPLIIAKGQFKELQEQLTHTGFGLELKNVAKLSGISRDVFDKYRTNNPNTELRISQITADSKTVITSKYWPHQLEEMRELISLALAKDKPECIQEYRKIEAELFPKRNWSLELQEFRVKVVIRRHRHNPDTERFVRYFDKTLKGVKRLRTLSERVLHLTDHQYDEWFKMQAENCRYCE